MREFAKSIPRFWIDECWRKIKKLSLEARVIAPYLLSNPHSNMIGIYYLPVPFIAHEIGLPYEATLEGLQSLCDIQFCSYDETTEYVWVHDMAFDQLGSQLKPNDNRVIAINRAYQALPDLPFLEAFHNKYALAFCLENKDSHESFFESAPKALQSNEKEKQNEKEKEIISMSGKPDVDTPFNKNDCVEKKQTTSMSKTSNSLKSQATEVLEFLNLKTGRAYRPVDTNLKLIMARLKSGISIAQCFQVIAKKTREWKGDTKMSEYLRPATLFNSTKFEQYVGELVKPKQEEKNI